MLRICLPSLAALLLCAGAATAQTAAPALDACIDLDASSQFSRGGSEQLLIKHGDAHYKLKFRSSCSDLPYSRKIQITSEGHKGRLCPSGSIVQTDRTSCPVAKIQTIDAGEFERLRRRR